MDTLHFWVLSLPFYSALMLPGCVFAGVVTSMLSWSKTNEYQMFMACGMATWRRHSIIISHGIIFGLLVFVLNGWILPHSQQSQVALLSRAMEGQWLPKLKSGRFNLLNIGDKSMLVFPSQQGDDKTMFIIESEPNTDSDTLYTVQKLQQKIHTQGAMLQLQQGVVYRFVAQRLQSSLQFGNMLIPMHIGENYHAISELDWENSQQLLASADPQAISLLLWRLNNSISTIILVCIAIMITPLYLCQQRPRVAMAEGLLLYFTYFFLLVCAKTQAVIYPAWELWLYSGAHVSILLFAAILSYLLNARLLRCY